MTTTSQASKYIASIDELLKYIEIDSTMFPVDISPNFPLRVPIKFVDKIEKGNPNDPLLRQILPLSSERESVLGYSLDPLSEQTHNPVSGLIHKYHGRVLLTLTGACDIHCRYCFRQHFDYQQNMPKPEQWREIITYIETHADIEEVILSGGDPLTLNNRRLFEVIDYLEAIPQLNTLRLHSRAAAILPERFDIVLLERLERSRLHIVLVIHCNHANELDDMATEALGACARRGITLLNQTVLLRGVNDDVEALAKLSHRLFSAQVMPYYLHLLDKVSGAAHFDIPIERAIALYWALMAKLPGYLVPKLVAEQPGYPHKLPANIFTLDSSR